MRLLIKQQDGRLFPLDLSALAKGVKKATHRHKFTYKGRPRLANDFLAPVEDYAYTHSPTSYSSILLSLSLLWRFLDANPHLSVHTLKGLTDVHGAALTLWIREKDVGPYRLLKRLVSLARAHHTLPEVYWPTIHDRVDPVRSRDLDPPTVLGVYRALINEAQQIKAMFQDGERLASKGSDPRGTQIGAGDRPKPSSWHVRENHAWLIKTIAMPTIVEKHVFKKQGARGLNQSNLPSQFHNGPTYLAPGHSVRASQGIVGKLRWFYPSLNDTIVFFLLFLLTTGWNESTALNIDITDPNWARTHKLQPKLKILKSMKPRSQSHQYAVSLEHSEWRPYQIVKYMLTVTEGLRRRLWIDIQELERDPKLANNRTLQHRLGVLRRRVRSPWLFHSLDHIGEVISLDTGFNSQINNVLADLLRRHDIRDIRGQRCKWTASDWRDAFAADSNERGGLLSMRIALGHGSNAALHHYLNQPRLRRRAELTVVKMTKNAFSEIKAGRMLDGSTLRILVERGSITETQRKRIANFKNRSRVGMGCLKPKNPPKDIAPDHTQGEACVIQRCALCSNGVVFDDSVDGLCKRFAELIKIQEMIPAITWSQSDYPHEKESVQEILSAFAATDVERCVTSHLARFSAGTSVVLDLEGTSASR